MDGNLCGALRYPASKHPGPDHCQFLGEMIGEPVKNRLYKLWAWLKSFSFPRKMVHITVAGLG